MDSFPNTARGDVAYWGLTPRQAMHYYSRLARMHADKATYFADLSVAYANKAVIASRVGVGFGALGFVAAAVNLVVRLVGHG